MLGTLADLFGNANGQTPVIVLVAGVLLLAAGWIGSRVFRSIRRQGTRLGALEQRLRLEVTRRRQVEQCLREDGIPLPYWPSDPAELHGITVRLRQPAEDQADEYDQAPATEARRIPVPPIPAGELEALARHRR